MRDERIALCAIGLDLGGSGLKGGIVDGAGKLLKVKQVPSPVHSHPEQIADALVTLLQALAEEANREGWQVVGAGVSSTLDVDPQTGCFLPPHFDHLQRWQGYPIAQYLESALSLPVLVENDGPMCAWGEYLVGAGKGYDSLVMVTLGSGVGGGVVLEGKRLPNTLGRAAYFGHLCIDLDGLICPCGRRGCWEMYVSATALERRAAEVVESEARPTHLGKQPTAQQVVAAAQDGDALATELLNELAGYLAVGLIDLANLFAPPLLVIGGGLSRAGELLLAPARQQMNALRLPICSEIALVASQLPFEAGLMGAALLALERFGGVYVRNPN
ncbi:MAG: ROK family protein [Anaerolineales bacterium]|nr:ROK family protein [Anaerolineales bacterium]MDW8162785.1 ROK family protein [Anaerolineales bacterium]